MAESSTRTVERALALLAVVSEYGMITLADAARETELSASTALRLLRTMESSGFICKEEAGYRPGMRLIQLGAHAVANESLALLAEPSLTRLVAETGESSYLVMPTGYDPSQGLYVAAKEGTHSVRHTSWVGRSIPLKGTAAGKILSGTAVGEPFVVVTDGVETDVTAIAAPVSLGGNVVAALSVLAPSYRMTPEKVQNIGRLLAEESQQFGTD